MNNMNLKLIKLVVFDFDGVFTNNQVHIGEKGDEYVTCYRSDGIGIERIKNLGIKVAILSSEKNNLVKKRAEKLEIYCINNIKDKGKALKDLTRSFDIELKNTMFVGNDINDIPAFKIAGLSVGVADCFEEAKRFTNFSLKKSGGSGAVREICDMLFQAHMN